MQRGSGSQFKRLEQGSAKCLEPILTHAATYPCHARGQLGVLWVLCGRECSSFQISPPSAALRGTAADIIVVGVRELYQHGWAADPMLQKVLLIGDAPAAEINFELLREQRERRLQQERERCRLEAEARRQAQVDAQEAAEEARRAAAEEAEALAKVVSAMAEPVNPDQVPSPESSDAAPPDAPEWQTLIPAHLLKDDLDSEAALELSYGVSPTTWRSCAIDLYVTSRTGSEAPPEPEQAASFSQHEPHFQEEEEVIFGQAVWLHVYDLTASFHLPVLNSALLRTGGGLFHAGIEVHGYEYSFGLRERGSGVYACAPRGNAAHVWPGCKKRFPTTCLACSGPCACVDG
ncbi:unnamed protein product [Symbiodinium natans]|uniref:PPPDE domain-containing protein n=1 Tax=Symbiodinium natans TaxID=878477 RepID=A0A812PS85_9DINO|nr:unnamed protein product [Symbiodinium natans]